MGPCRLEGLGLLSCGVDAGAVAARAASFQLGPSPSPSPSPPPTTTIYLSSSHLNNSPSGCMCFCLRADKPVEGVIDFSSISFTAAEVDVVVVLAGAVGARAVSARMHDTDAWEN